MSPCLWIFFPKSHMLNKSKRQVLNIKVCNSKIDLQRRAEQHAVCSRRPADEKGKPHEKHYIYISAALIKNKSWHWPWSNVIWRAIISRSIRRTSINRQQTVHPSAEEEGGGRGGGGEEGERGGQWKELKINLGLQNILAAWQWFLIFSGNNIRIPIKLYASAFNLPQIIGKCKRGLSN